MFSRSSPIDADTEYALIKRAVPSITKNDSDTCPANELLVIRVIANDRLSHGFREDNRDDNKLGPSYVG